MSFTPQPITISMESLSDAIQLTVAAMAGDAEKDQPGCQADDTQITGTTPTLKARRKRSARPTSGTSKLTGEDYSALYQREYRRTHPEKATRFRINTYCNFLRRMGWVVIPPGAITDTGGDPGGGDPYHDDPADGSAHGQKDHAPVVKAQDHDLTGGEV